MFFLVGAALQRAVFPDFPIDVLFLVQIPIDINTGIKPAQSEEMGKFLGFEGTSLIDAQTQVRIRWALLSTDVITVQCLSACSLKVLVSIFAACTCIPFHACILLLDE